MIELKVGMKVRLKSVDEITRAGHYGHVVGSMNIYLNKDYYITNIVSGQYVHLSTVIGDFGNAGSIPYSWHKSLFEVIDSILSTSSIIILNQDF